MMKAAVYHGFSQPIQIESIPKPTLSNQNPNDATSIIIQVMATGVCRSDWHGWKGHDSDIIQHGLPFIPGHEFSGIIVEIGHSLLNFKFQIGDRVAIPFILPCGSCIECHMDRCKPTICMNQQQPGFTFPGSFAEYIKIPRADKNVVKTIPDNVSFVEAAALGCRFTTAFRAVVQQGLQWTERDYSTTSRGSSDVLSTLTDNGKNVITTNKRPNRTIAIFGCGGVGLSCIMIAKAFQQQANFSQIIAIDISQEALHKSQELGATHIVHMDLQNNTTATSNQDVRNQVLKYTHGIGVDISIDAAGFKSTCENAVWCTRRGGRMIQVGLPLSGVNNDDNDEHAHRPQPPIIPMHIVAGRELELVGSHGFASDDLPILLNMVKDELLNVKQLIEKEVSLEEGARVLMDMDYKSPLGMTIITRFDDQSKL